MLFSNFNIAINSFDTKKFKLYKNYNKAPWKEISKLVVKILKLWSDGEDAGHALNQILVLSNYKSHKKLPKKSDIKGK